MILEKYITDIRKEYSTNRATEHTYRTALKNLIESIDEKIIAVNEPKQIPGVGAPDYFIATKKDIIEIGYIEAKDIGKNINHKDYKPQFDKYKKAISNIIFTDYMKFEFYKKSKLYKTIEIASLENGKIIPNEENFETFINHIQDFTRFVGQTIKSPSALAKMMAQKAKFMSDEVFTYLDKNSGKVEDELISNQYKTFKILLIHDMDTRQFANMYAQTITYGLFVARFHDTTLETFSRHEAATLLPNSNPFLRNFFQHIAGFDVYSRISWQIDSLVNIFHHTDIKALLKDFGNSTAKIDPMIHFYEEFLSEFDPKL